MDGRVDIDLYAILSAQGLILLYLVVGLAYLVGNTRIFGMPLGPTIGVLLTGLLFGHFGLALPTAVGTFGVTSFIFSVGLRAGPSFFGALKEDGKRYLVLSFVAAVSGLALALAASRLFGFDAGFDAGMLAGSLPSTPTLAAAQDAVRSGIGYFADGLGPEQVIGNIGVGYAIAYLAGTMTIILTVLFAPRLLRMNLEAMARTYAQEMGRLAHRGRMPTTEKKRCPWSGPIGFASGNTARRSRRPRLTRVCPPSP